jgi:endonuclease-3
MTETERRTKLKKKIRVIDNLLVCLYGRHEVEGTEDPLDTLVETILSQNTTDINSHRSFLALKKEYPKWELLLGQDPKNVSKIIRSGGLPDIKAERILRALEFIKRSRGRLSIDFLRDMSPSEADSWLGQMKGVGPKTRSIVLLFSLGMPAFPVDTHIHRVSKRLGLIGLNVTRERAQLELGSLVPKRDFYNFHINLIEHGRAVCHARKPKCAVCALSRMCDFYRATKKAQS